MHFYQTHHLCALLVVRFLLGVGRYKKQQSHAERLQQFFPSALYELGVHQFL